MEANWKLRCAAADIFARRYAKAFARVRADSPIVCARSQVAAMGAGAARRKPALFVNSASLAYCGLTSFYDQPRGDNTPPGHDRWTYENIQSQRVPS